MRRLSKNGKKKILDGKEENQKKKRKKVDLWQIPSFIRRRERRHSRLDKQRVEKKNKQILYPNSSGTKGGKST